MSSKGLRDMFEALGPRDDVILNPYSNCDKGWLHHDDIEVGGVPLVPNMTIEQLGHILPSLKKLNVGTDKTLMPTTFCAMYCTLIPRRVFDRVGLLNTQFSNGGEDYDYSERAKRHGFQTYWTRNAFCFHFGGKTRKVAEEANHTAHHKEDEQNNSLLHRKWHTKQRKIVGIWSGPSWGSDSGWGLDTYKTTGIGGSELCAGRLAETAAANGCHVLMYGDHVRSTQNGVDLIPWQDFRPEEEWFDLFIASRKLDPVTEQLRARKVVVISHDIWLMSGQHISPFHRNKVDKFVCLSPWHKKFFTEYHALPDGKVVVIPNGVNVEMFSPEKTWEQKIATKEYARLHYSSSADRGLTDNILYLLPWLKDAVPELTLHVYYGLNTWKDAARYRNDKNAMQQIENLEKTLESMKDFVFTYGRVNQPTLAEAWSKAYLWFFPTQFSETFCLTACEAQASATPIVCSNVAALETTVGDYGMKVMHNPYSKEGRQFFINYVVGLCKDREQWEHWSRKSFEGGLRRLSWQERWEDYWSQFL
jgi:glycosyltransferase involved in cell wall biosynthesis